jgi:hypothetical protein
MDVPHVTCTKEQQAVLRFLWAEGLPCAEMHRRMSVQDENSVVLQQSVCKWIERFKHGHTSIKHEKGARPATEGNGIGMACLSAQNFLF